MNSQVTVLKTQSKITSKKPKILLVEDDLHWQILISAALRSAYSEVDIRCVKTVQKAEQLLCSGHLFNLIIADQNLQGNKAGIDFWRQCQSNHHSQIPFMLVSGMSETGYHNVFIREEKYPIYMSKPFDITIFKSIINWQIVENKGLKNSSKNKLRISKSQQ